MTDLEILQSQLRETKMRLRELRTENAELKIQQRRWLFMCVGVSGFSLLLSSVLLFTSGDIVIEDPNLPRTFDSTLVAVDSRSVDPRSMDSTSVETAAPLPVEDLAAPEPVVLDGGFGSSEPELEDPLAPPPIDDSALAVDAPELAMPTSPPEPKPAPLTLPSSGSSFSPPASQGFSLPGSSSRSKRRVEQYRVKKNDSLWKIVNRYYGTATPKKIQKVMKDNGLSNTQIMPGSTLLLIIDP
jgi:hypothetical protein